MLDWEEVRNLRYMPQQALDDGDDLPIVLAQRLEFAKEKWRREQSERQAGFVGTEERFRQAAWATDVTMEIE